MDFGVTMFPTHYAIRPDDLAREAESRGFESVWFPEHTHIPASRRSPWPGGPNLPKEYSHTFDLFVAMTMAAAATKKLKVASGICLLVERDPITTAKELASLDVLSGGRVLFGIGGGWNAEEMEHHGTEFRTRWKLLRERVEAMRAIWTQDEASYAGELVRFDPIWSWPKPLQKPGPPVILGAHGPKALERVVNYCDGWIPIGVRAGDLLEEIKKLHVLAVEKGRDPKTISVNVYGTPADADLLKQMRDVGVSRAVFGLPAAGAEKVLPMLDMYAEAMRAVG
ncbi:MAG TPA: LLM class F420-dependent oxidoreductase [Candidatus Binatia bacterium]|jgi:probable F420-dependent oxidoreductase|nr:LLM class F420-dependent oxidoreductase [Candidatus Binatia bacterium]